MQRFLVAGLLALTFTGATAAQDAAPAPKPGYTPQVMLRRIQRESASAQEPQQQSERVDAERLPVDVRNAIRDQRSAFSCAVPQSTRRVALNAVATFKGRSYRCVEVFGPSPDGTVQPQGVGWIRADAPTSGSSAR